MKKNKIIKNTLLVILGLVILFFLFVGIRAFFFGFTFISSSYYGLEGMFVAIEMYGYLILIIFIQWWYIIIPVIILFIIIFNKIVNKITK